MLPFDAGVQQPTVCLSEAPRSHLPPRFNLFFFPHSGLLPCIMNAAAPPSPTDNHFYLYIFTGRNARQHNPLTPPSDFCCCCCHIYSVFSRLSVTLSFWSAAGMKRRRLQTRLQEQSEELGCKNGWKIWSIKSCFILLKGSQPVGTLEMFQQGSNQGPRSGTCNFKTLWANKAQGWIPLYAWRSNVLCLKPQVTK